MDLLTPFETTEPPVTGRMQHMKTIPYILISLLGGAIIPLQLAMVNAFRQSTQAGQIQATFYLYAGGTIASLLLSTEQRHQTAGTAKRPMSGSI